MKKTYNILILWWTWNFWSRLTKFIKENFDNINIFINWKEKQKWVQLEKDLWVKFTSLNKNIISNSDIIILSVSISKTIDILKKISEHIKSWTILFDVTSIKWPISTQMNKLEKKWVISIPTHPMFGPYIKTTAWQVIVLTPTKTIKNNEIYIKFKDFLQKKNFKIIETTPKIHDYNMALIQWLTHYVLFCMWKTIADLKFDIWNAQDFISPIYKIIESSIWRYLRQDPKLYAQIQMNNPLILKVHKYFINSTNFFNNIVKKNQQKKFESTIHKLNNFFWEYSLKWQKYTDKIIFLNSKQIENLKKNIWKKIKLENIYNWKIKEWIISNFKNWIINLNNENLDFNEWTII